ncbi:MAG: hypothetical protein KH024_15070 [Hungatella hathewayi]|nr:hypothetical protein [Hungatella hathewayi]
MRTRVSLLLLLGLLMCGTSALAAESNDNERFPQNQEALSFVLAATPAEAEAEAAEAEAAEAETAEAEATEAEATETEAEIKTATALNAVETDIPEETDIVSNFEDLHLWLENLDGYGGEVVLGDTITIKETISPSYNYTGPLSIDTGSFGLIYDGGYIDYCDLFLTGEGVDIPVLEIRNTGNGFGWLPPLDWNMVLSFMDVTALGRDGIGGTAVQISSDSHYRRSTASFESRGQIHSYGRHAVGLALAADTPLETYCLNIDVDGDNSRAVTSVNGADFFLCRLSAQGDGAAAASGDSIVLDTCCLSPEPENIEVIYRTIERPIGIEPQIQQYADVSDVADAVCFYEPTRFLLTGGRYLDVSLLHNKDGLSSLDTSTLGSVDFPITLPDTFQGFGLEGGSDFSIRVWVRDPDLPVIKSMNQEENTLRFFSWDNAKYKPGTILWCSEDNEKTWIDISKWEAVTWNTSYRYYLFEIEADKITKPVSLALETKKGWSNIVTLTPGEQGAIHVGTGGDRDGGDREEQPGGDGGVHGGGSGDSGDSPDGDSSSGGSGGSPDGDSSGGNTGGPPDGDSSGGSTDGSSDGDSSGESTGGSSETITKPETETTPGSGTGSGNANGPGPSHGASSGTSHGPGAETSHETDADTFPYPGANKLPAVETETSPETNAMANSEAETAAPGKPSSSRPAGSSAQRDDITPRSQKTSEQSPGYSGSPEPVQPETDAESSPTDSTSPSTDTDNGALEALETGSILPAASPSSPIPELALPALVFLSAGGITTCTVYRKKRRKNR